MRKKKRMARPYICVPIVGLVRYGILDEAKMISSSVAEMAEWRIDYFAGYEIEISSIIGEIKKILGDKKLIVTLRSVSEGGEANGERFDYFNIIETIIDDDIADFIDVEIDRDPEKLCKLCKKAQDKHISIIGSYHDFKKTPPSDQIIKKLTDAKKYGCYAAKTAYMPTSYDDVYKLLSATERTKDMYPDFPIITMSMGKLGTSSRLYGGLYGSAVTFATLTKASAPGQRSVEHISEVFDKLYADPGHIILIGFMGVGKSTVSRELSEIMDIPEFDTDDMIEKKCDCSINELFDKGGEKLFRSIETDILDELGKYEKAVISCGGGTVLKDINVKKLRAFGTIVELSATPETVYKRVRGTDDRPILRNHMDVEYIAKLMEQRKGAYESAADVSVVTDGRYVNDIANEIITACENLNMADSDDDLGWFVETF